MEDVQLWQWILVIGFGLLFIIIAPYSKTLKGFFSAESETGKQPAMLLLSASLLISWIFAKSISNAANLGLEYGMVGGISYAVYYLSFIVAGIIIYQLRVKGGYRSIHEFLRHKFGHAAVIVFSVLIAFRLFNEVWSNTMVIGSYFGPQGSESYYLSILIFTFLTLAYTIKGGLRSSLLTDAIQMLFFSMLLILLLGLILPQSDRSVSEYIHSGEWSSSMGLNLFFVALLQVLSYPFHDPVLTDRGFLSSPSNTLKAYLIAGVTGFILLSLFSFIGIYARMENLSGEAAVEVSKLLGPITMLAMNFIMITSAASTLDSSFSSFAKLTVIDLRIFRLPSVNKGRLIMIVIAAGGTLPIFMNPSILSATTISGTMVMGLAPVFILWQLAKNSYSFHIPVMCGIAFGLLYSIDCLPEFISNIEGPYGKLLGANVWGLITCFVGFFISLIIKTK